MAIIRQLVGEAVTVKGAAQSLLSQSQRTAKGSHNKHFLAFI